MRKLIFILPILLCSVYAYSQVPLKVLANGSVGCNTSGDTCISTDINLVKGGWRTVATVSALNAIPALQRSNNMWVYVTSTDSVYRDSATLVWQPQFKLSQLGLIGIHAVRTNDASLTLDYSTDYVFTGTTTTWTLPAVLSLANGRLFMITIKNRGSGDITLNSDTGSTLWSTSAVSSITIASGEAVRLMPDGVFFNVE